RGSVLLIAPAGSGLGEVEKIGVTLRRNGREALLGYFGLTPDALAHVPRSADQSVVLRLRETDVLCKTLTLPLAAERDLDQVLTFEMDRETPFSDDEVFWSHRIVGRDRQRGQLSVRLFLVPRPTLGRLLDALAQAGMRPHRAEIAGGSDEGT